MAENEPVQGTAPSGTPETPTAPEKGDGTSTFTQQQVSDLLAKQKGDVERRYSDYNDLKARATRADELEAAQQTDLEKVTGERDSLKDRLTPLEGDNLRLRVAMEKNLPAPLMDRLKGGSKEEMEADADQLLQLVGEQRPETSFDGGPRGTVDNADDMNAAIRRAAGRT